MKSTICFVAMIVIIILSILFSVFRQTIFKIPPEAMFQPIMIGEPLIIENNREYLSLIDNVYASNNRVYVLFSEMHLVKVYDTDCNYICTYIVSSKSSHGSHAQMYVRDDALYLSAASDLYEFMDKHFVGFHRYSDNPSLIAELNHNKSLSKNKTDCNQRRYFVRGGNVYRKDSSGIESLFLKRSPFYFVCSPIIPWILWSIVVAVVIFINCKAKIKVET